MLPYPSMDFYGKPTKLDRVTKWDSAFMVTYKYTIKGPD